MPIGPLLFPSQANASNRRLSVPLFINTATRAVKHRASFVLARRGPTCNLPRPAPPRQPGESSGGPARPPRVSAGADQRPETQGRMVRQRQGDQDWTQVQSAAAAAQHEWGRSGQGRWEPAGSLN